MVNAPGPRDLNLEAVMAEENSRSARVARKCADVSRIFVKEEIRARVKQV